MISVALLANALTADMGMIPGFAPVGPALGLPLSVLAAFLERPFYTCAGVERNALRYSLQANFLSLLAGVVGLAVFAPIVMSPLGAAFGWFVPPAAVALSVLVEGLYLRPETNPRSFGWNWVIGANVFSAAICVVVMIVSSSLRDSYPAFARMFRPGHDRLEVGLAVVCLGVFIASFCGAARRDSSPQISSTPESSPAASADAMPLPTLRAEAEH
ncbi:MAG: hypothetical protein K8U03_26520 [Planctomycetia bacterium]|nr:hypothetical protein [Planctomycetia bacterium]